MARIEVHGQLRARRLAERRWAARHHLGRTDNQVKVKGNRIELEEVEAHLRRAADSEVVAVVAWPIVDGSAQGLVGYCTSPRTADEITAAMLQTLPRYMVPAEVVVRSELPRSPNGKFDRVLLREELTR